MVICTADVALLAIVFLHSFIQPVAGSMEMHKLQERLLGSYSEHVRPVVRETDAVEVNVSMHLEQVLDLDLKSQTFRASGFFDVVWHDWYLTWTPEDSANITRMVISQTLLWLPDLVVSNDIRTISLFSNGRTRVQVEYDGTVTWQPDFLTETYCKVDIHKYPFDQQECVVVIEPWMTGNQQMKVHYANIVSGTVVTNGEFRLVDTRISTTKYLPTFTEDYMEVGHFIVVFQRKSRFYLLSTVLPLAAFSLLSPLAPLVPADSGEKITLSVTVLLANLVFMGTLADSMPHVGDSISVFVLYASFQIILSFTAVIANIIIVCLPHASPGNTCEGRKETGKAKTSNLIRSSEHVYTNSDPDDIYQIRVPDNIEERTMEHSTFPRNISEWSIISRRMKSNYCKNKMAGGLPNNCVEMKTCAPGVQTSGRVMSPTSVWLDKTCFLAFFVISLVVNAVTMSILLI